MREMQMYRVVGVRRGAPWAIPNVAQRRESSYGNNRARDESAPMSNPDRIAEILKRVEAATPVKRSKGCDCTISTNCNHPVENWVEQKLSDANFAAGARKDIPYLLGELSKAREALKVATDALDYIVSHAGAAEKPKWGNEFVEVARIAIDRLRSLVGEDEDANV
jgi:hypothetical protein